MPRQLLFECTPFMLAASRHLNSTVRFPAINRKLVPSPSGQ